LAQFFVLKQISNLKTLINVAEIDVISMNVEISVKWKSDFFY